MGIDCILYRISQSIFDSMSDQSRQIQESAKTCSSPKRLNEKKNETPIFPKIQNILDVKKGSNENNYKTNLENNNKTRRTKRLETNISNLDNSVNVNNLSQLLSVSTVASKSKSNSKGPDYLPGQYLEDRSPAIQKPQKFIITRAGFKRKRFAGLKGSTNSHVIIKSDLKGLKERFLFAVSEGHGTCGSYLSETLKKNLVSIIESSVPLNNSESAVPALGSLNTVILSHFKTRKIDISYSTCSLIAFLVFGQKILVFNSGDCGGVVGKADNKTGGKGLCLRQAVTSESRRIQDRDGLADGYDRGVFGASEVIEVDAMKDDKIAVIGSRDVWELVSHQEALDLCVDGLAAQKTEMCCEALIRRCESKVKGTNRKVADISVIVFFIN